MSHVFLIYDPMSSEYVGVFDSKKTAIEGVKGYLGDDIKVTMISEYRSGRTINVHYKTSSGYKDVIGIDKMEINKIW